jgi:hypothetical protein
MRTLAIVALLCVTMSAVIASITLGFYVRLIRAEFADRTDEMKAAWAKREDWWMRQHDTSLARWEAERETLRHQYALVANGSCSDDEAAVADADRGRVVARPRPLARGDACGELGVSLRTVRYHLYEAAKRIPGDMPAEAKVVAWARGASLDVLEGRSLRFEVMRDGQRAAASG